MNAHDDTNGAELADWQAEREARSVRAWTWCIGLLASGCVAWGVWRWVNFLD